MQQQAEGLLRSVARHPEGRLNKSMSWVRRRRLQASSSAPSLSSAAVPCEQSSREVAPASQVLSPVEPAITSEAVKEERRNERIVARLMAEEHKRSWADLRSWRAEEAARRELTQSSEQPELNEIQQLAKISSARPRPPTPPPFVRRMLHEQTTEAAEVADRVAEKRRLATVQTKREAAARARGAEVARGSRRRELTSLSATVACNVSMIERHVSDEYVRRARYRDFETSALAGTREREARREAAERCRLARADVLEARRLHRRACADELRAQISKTRNLVAADMDRVRSSKAPFRLSDANFSSAVPLDPAFAARKRRAKRISDWRAAVRDDHLRVERVRSARLDAYVAHRSLSQAASRRAEHYGPSDQLPVLDGSQHFDVDPDDPRDSDLGVLLPPAMKAAARLYGRPISRERC